tara:strand:+ start:387 stop:578 length:192 start_codon:yes stop_codon:yes gene_type:complete
MGDKSIKGQSPILFDPLLKERPKRPRPLKRLRGISKGVDPNKIKPPVLQERPIRQISKKKLYE